MRADHVGAYGYERDTTPSLDRLASEGTLFEQAYSVTSWTLPSHASLLTGLYPSAHGVTRPRNRLADAHTTLAEALAAEGYQTSAVVSGPYLRRWSNLAQGFESYDDSPITEPGRDAAVDVTNPRVEAALERFFAEGRDPSRPFFLFVYLWDSHHHYLPPPPYDAMFVPEGAEPIAHTDVRFDPGFRLERDISPAQLAYLIAQYDGEIRASDALLGRLWERLEREGLWEDTAVLVTADHGEEFFDHGTISHKNHLFDETVRVPLVLKRPGGPQAARDPRPVSHVDVFATLLELAGASAPPPPGSRSLLAQDSSPPVFMELVTDWWFPMPDGETRHESNRWRAVRSGRYKLMELHAREQVRANVFDLERDPSERAPSGLSEEHAELAALLERWRVANAALAAGVGEAPLSAEEEEQLRALGYLQ